MASWGVRLLESAYSSRVIRAEREFLVASGIVDGSNGTTRSPTRMEAISAALKSLADL